MGCKAPGGSLFWLIGSAIVATRGRVILNGHRASPHIPDIVLGTRGRSGNATTSLAAFFVTHYQSLRVKRLHEYLQSGSLPSDVRFDYWFVNWTTSNDTRAHNLFPPDKWRDMIRRHPQGRHTMHDLTAKHLFSMQFFLENTTSRWFFRGTDDTFVNFRALGPFLFDLENRCIPLREFVFLANCVRWGTFMYPQGGSGYFMSRRAVEILSPLGEELQEWTKGQEDMDLGTFLRTRLKFHPASMTTGAIIGHSFEGDNLPKIKQGSWNELPPCPLTETRSARFCRPFLAPLRDIVFYHDWPPRFLESFANAAAVFDAPPNIGWYIDSLFPVVCKLGPSQIKNVSQWNF
jgi:hypothetical protein